MSMRLPKAPVVACATLLSLSMVAAQAETIYRCPDNSYTNQRSVVAKLHCQPVTQANVSVVGSDSSSPSLDASAPQAMRLSRHGEDAHKVSASASRKDEARALLEQELVTQQARLAQQTQALEQGKAVRNGNERNYQAYLDRVGALQKQVQITQANVAALQAQIARYSAK